MKITHISNAGCIYEQDGFRLLADPWLSDSAFEGAWIHETPIKTKPQDLLDVDALYISHLHQDHCDPETLKYFRRDIPIYTLKDQFSLCKRELEKMGFSNVIALVDSQWDILPGISLTMFAPFSKHPFHASDIGNVVDSALLIETNDGKVLNCNDNSLTVEKSKWFRETYGQIDVAQLNWNSAGPWPSCFIMSDEEKFKAHHAVIERNLSYLYEVSKALGAKYVQPFAGAYKLSGERDHLNKYLGTCTADRASDYLEDRGIKTIVLKEGESFELGG